MFILNRYERTSETHYASFTWRSGRSQPVLRHRQNRRLSQNCSRTGSFSIGLEPRYPRTGKASGCPSLQPMPLQRFQRLCSVLCGPYSGGIAPEQAIPIDKMIPLNMRQSSTRDLPRLVEKKGRKRSICSSVSHYRSLISSLIIEPETDCRTQIDRF